MNNKPSKLRSAYAQVLGRPGSFPTEAHKIVYAAMQKESQEPAPRINVTSESRGQICPNETLAQTAKRDYIIDILEQADYESDDK